MPLTNLLSGFTVMLCILIGVVVTGCTSNKDRVGRLLSLLRDKGLEGEPTLESCRALYSGPAQRRRGPKPGTKRGPRKSRLSAASPHASDNEPEPDKEAKGNDSTTSCTTTLVLYKILLKCRYRYRSYCRINS